MSQSQLRFPDNQEVWLKDLASFLNLKLEKVPDPDPTFKGKAKGKAMIPLPLRTLAFREFSWWCAIFY